MSVPQIMATQITACNLWRSTESGMRGLGVSLSADIVLNDVS